MFTGHENRRITATEREKSATTVSRLSILAKYFSSAYRRMPHEATCWRHLGLLVGFEGDVDVENVKAR